MTDNTYLSKVVRYKAKSKHPHRTAYYMCENGASMLWDEYDSSETKNWELKADNGIVTLFLYYKDLLDGESYEEILQTALENFWTSRRTKFSIIQ